MAGLLELPDLIETILSHMGWRDRMALGAASSRLAAAVRSHDARRHNGAYDPWLAQAKQHRALAEGSWRGALHAAAPRQLSAGPTGGGGRGDVSEAAAAQAPRGPCKPRGAAAEPPPPPAPGPAPPPLARRRRGPVVEYGGMFRPSEDSLAAVRMVLYDGHMTALAAGGPAADLVAVHHPPREPDQEPRLSITSLLDLPAFAGPAARRRLGARPAAAAEEPPAPPPPAPGRVLWLSPETPAAAHLSAAAWPLPLVARSPRPPPPLAPAAAGGAGEAASHASGQGQGQGQGQGPSQGQGQGLGSSGGGAPWPGAEGARGCGGGWVVALPAVPGAAEATKQAGGLLDKLKDLAVRQHVLYDMYGADVTPNGSSSGGAAGAVRLTYLDVSGHAPYDSPDSALSAGARRNAAGGPELYDNPAERLYGNPADRLYGNPAARLYGNASPAPSGAAAAAAAARPDPGPDAGGNPGSHLEWLIASGACGALRHLLARRTAAAGLRVLRRLGREDGCPRLMTLDLSGCPLAPPPGPAAASAAAAAAADATAGGGGSAADGGRSSGSGGHSRRHRRGGGGGGADGGAKGSAKGRGGEVESAESARAARLEAAVEAAEVAEALAWGREVAAAVGRLTSLRVLRLCDVDLRGFFAGLDTRHTPDRTARTGPPRSSGPRAGPGAGSAPSGPRAQGPRDARGPPSAPAAASDGSSSESPEDIMTPPPPAPPQAQSQPSPLQPAWLSVVGPTLGRLYELELDGSCGFIKADLAFVLATAPHLQRLSVARCRCLALGPALLPLAPAAPPPPVTSSSHSQPAAAGPGSSLRQLRLGWGFGPATVRQICTAAGAALTSLDLDVGASVGDADLAAVVAACPHLQRLRLALCPVTGVGIGTALASCTKIHVLHVINCVGPFVRQDLMGPLGWLPAEEGGAGAERHATTEEEGEAAGGERQARGRSGAGPRQRWAMSDLQLVGGPMQLYDEDVLSLLYGRSMHGSLGDTQFGKAAEECTVPSPDRGAVGSDGGEGGDTWRRRRLGRLQTLALAGLPYLSDALLRHLASYCQDVRHVRLEGCGYERQRLSTGGPSGAEARGLAGPRGPFTAGSLLRWLLRCGQLENLRLRHCCRLPADVAAVLSTGCLRLEALLLDTCDLPTCGLEAAPCVYGALAHVALARCREDAVRAGLGGGGGGGGGGAGGAEGGAEGGKGGGSGGVWWHPVERDVKLPLLRRHPRPAAAGLQRRGGRRPNATPAPSPRRPLPSAAAHASSVPDRAPKDRHEGYVPAAGEPLSVEVVAETPAFLAAIRGARSRAARAAAASVLRLLDKHAARSPHTSSEAFFLFAEDPAVGGAWGPGLRVWLMEGAGVVELDLLDHLKYSGHTSAEGSAGTAAFPTQAPAPLVGALRQALEWAIKESLGECPEVSLEWRSYHCAIGASFSSSIGVRTWPQVTFLRVSWD
ncbi:hypothetical protein HYH03_007987 [Edaphochlamys debaryana]|uniref:F-box domain-containing protein n=1 Tax=Edaphochlamys debaryana TaxID=47281 RepID=A0A836BYF8_9CHLO|nr:hypothetical protein HYH03_007987 [Edaphochlamys debaryana]|eukprot:KAG2493766.1 hypothetical protein HYH03_007987 [Edaphochlamys debaryana]